MLTSCGAAHTLDPSDDPRGRVRLDNAAGAEGATAPETLRPMDRVGDDTLESDDCLTGSVHRRA